ncbi:MAG: hypothetical protein DRJ21_00520 [Candidatus Methanomethylicota archaeon]|uniref:Uncharacterized protein n=1 Tax=Thermoproteota archaeon TaxID=2056631 RepID=A0A497EX06_9CREN|nr:MAG: hypothetical protein DRJ21_00520 [Candidatus Verstraetearchaeota archaeon]
MIEFKWNNFTIKIFSIEERQIEDLGFCAYLSKKNPLWLKGLVVCACCDILDARSIAKEFLKNKTILMEQVCYSIKPNYERVIKVKDGDVIISTPLIKAYGLFKALGEFIIENILNNKTK